MPLADQITEEQTQLAHLRKENERLRKHLLEVELQWEESLNEIKGENEVLREESASLKNLLAKNTEAERLTQAMAEMERGYEKHIQVLQATLQKVKQENEHKVVKENGTSDMIEKSIVRELLQILMNQKQRADAKEQALKVLCESVGIATPQPNKCPRSQKEVDDFEKVGLGDLWIAYLMQKTK